MTKQPYRLNMDGGFASEDPAATMDQIAEVLDNIGVQNLLGSTGSDRLWA